MYVTHIDVGCGGTTEQTRAMKIRFHPFSLFLFRLVWTWAIEHTVEMVGPRGMGRGRDDMRYDYDTRANYCIISAGERYG